MALDLGPCAVYFGVAGSEADLGKTEGGVVVTFAEDVADLKSDQFGTQPEDQVITGHGASVKIPLADYTLDTLATVLNRSKLALSGDHGIKGSGLVGTKKSAQAKSLIVKKYVDGAVSTDSDDWITFPAAAPLPNFDVSFSKDNQRIIEVTFMAYPYGADDVLYYIGDETAAEGGS